MDISIPQKRCNRCKQLLPATTDYFCRSRNRPYGLHERCKQCRHEAERKPPKPIDVEHEGLQRCTKCQEWKPATLQFFGRQHTVKSGLRSLCKECQKAYSFAYYHEDRTRLKHHKQKPAYKEQQRQYAKNRRPLYGDMMRQRQRNWYASHPDQRRVEAHRRRARERAVGGSYTAHDIQDQFKRQKGKCYYCKSKVDKDYHVDHVIPIIHGGANTKDNIVIACPTCNESKHAKLPHEWPQGGRLL